ncbi:MAG: helix-turn-helix transcriptional regulator [Okeania sp. SIO3C4]|nr:helix-turn-helix transcriptional regulator [Okeania sp. SIO3C4]
MIHKVETTIEVECLIHTFAKNVRMFRKKNGLSQHELAQLLATSRQWISDVERAKVPVRLETIMKLAIVLRVKPEDLVHET